jgi:quercetin dioxygenase-like cupin family protein
MEETAMATSQAVRQACSYQAPGAGERFSIFDDNVTVKVTGMETGGAYALLTITIAPGGGPPLHTHPQAETCVVLSGEFAFVWRDGGDARTVQAGAGCLMHAPGGAPHRFENVGETPGTVLIVCEPATLDFLRAMSVAFPPGAGPDMETLLDLSAQHGIESIYEGEGARPEPPSNGATSAEARALAWRFQQANDALVDLIEGCTATQWRATCADTGWSVAVQAHHLAVNHAYLAGMIQQIAIGEPPAPITIEVLDAINAQHAEAFAQVSLAETVALLRENGAMATQIYRGLSDEQLARTATTMVGAPPSSVAGLIMFLSIGEIERHGQAIREAIEASR